MTLHIEIDRNTEKQLAAIAILKNLSVEEVASSYLKETVRKEEEYNAKLREKLKTAENSPLIENFSADAFLQEMKEKHGLNVKI